MSRLMPVGKRVAMVGGRHFGRAGTVTEQPTGYPQWYRVRLDGKTGLTVPVAPNDLGPVSP